MGRRKKKAQQAWSAASKEEQQQLLQQQSNCYEGERLARFLKSLEREIELAKNSEGVLPEKIWIKQQFATGSNEVTRILERMKPIAKLPSSDQESTLDSSRCEEPSVCLQAVLLASDCNPRWLTKHILCLASSRRVPLIFVKDKKAGSVRLGEVVKIKTALAIGVKAKGSGINKLIEEILHERGSDDDAPP